MRATEWWLGRGVALGIIVTALDGCGGRLGTDPGEGGDGGSEESGGTGGSSGSGGVAGTEVSGAGASGGAGGSAGTAGAGGTAGAQGGGTPIGATGGVVTLPGVTCDLTTAITKSCAISSCHGRLFAYGGLVWSPDAELISRIKDKPATFQDLDCDPDPVGYVACAAPPPECQPYVGAKLVDSANPEASFIFTKLRVMDPGEPRCGNQMPLAPGDSPDVGWNEERRACIEQFVRAVAALP